MESITNIERSERLAQLNGSTTVINSEGFYRGRCRLLASIMSNSLFNEYNFDRTKIIYRKDGSYRKAESYGVLSEAQIMASLVYMRLEQLELFSIMHLDSEGCLGMGISNINNYSDSMEFISPESNDWILDNTLKNYSYNKTSMVNRVAVIDYENTDLSSVVALFNRHDNVLRVNKIIIEDKQVHLIESESVCVVLVGNELITVELSDYARFKELMRNIKSEIKGKYQNIQNIVVI